MSVNDAAYFWAVVAAALLDLVCCAEDDIESIRRMALVFVVGYVVQRYDRPPFLLTSTTVRSYGPPRVGARRSHRPSGVCDNGAVAVAVAATYTNSWCPISPGEFRHFIPQFPGGRLER